MVNAVVWPMNIPDDDIQTLINSIDDTAVMALVSYEGDVGESDERRSKVKFVLETEFTDLHNRIMEKVYALADTFFPEVVVLNSHLQITEYDESYQGHFDWHKDGQSDDHSSDPLIAKRLLSFSIQLSDRKDYEGGDFQFQDDPDFSIPNKRQMVLFTSDTVHRVTPVTKGTRYALVGWLSGVKNA